MSAYSNGPAKFQIEAKRRVIQKFSRLTFLPVTPMRMHRQGPLTRCSLKAKVMPNNQREIATGSAQQEIPLPNAHE